MVYAMQHGIEHIRHNMELLRPGITIPELSAQAHCLDPQYQRGKYGCLMHGVGLCDEWPLVAYADQAVPGSFDYPLEAGMTLCVEALISPEGGDFSIKLEDQVLITEDGYENLTRYPYDPALASDVA
jgi:Xaa-Pro aminopeptidase